MEPFSFKQNVLPKAFWFSLISALVIAPIWYVFGFTHLEGWCSIALERGIGTQCNHLFFRVVSFPFDVFVYYDLNIASMFMPIFPAFLIVFIALFVVSSILLTFYLRFLKK